MDDRVATLLAVIVLFGTYTAIVGLVPYLYFRHHKNFPLKRRVNKLIAILSATMMFLFTTLTTRLSVGLLSLIPLTLITYLNIRNTIVCAVCCRTIHRQSRFTVRWHHSKCAERDPAKFY